MLYVIDESHYSILCKYNVIRGKKETDLKTHVYLRISAITEINVFFLVAVQPLRRVLLKFVCGNLLLRLRLEGPQRIHYGLFVFRK